MHVAMTSMTRLESGPYVVQGQRDPDVLITRYHLGNYSLGLT